VLRIHKQHFLRLLVEVPEVATAVMQVLAQRLSQTNRALTEAHAKIRELTQAISETSPG
jgi:CRP-like cAMP-binding protein